MLELVLLAVLAILALTCFLLTKQTRRIHSMTKHIPGPSRLPVLGNALEFLSDADFNSVSRIATHLDEYNDVLPMWMGPKDLVIFISHPDDLQVFFSSTKITDRGKSYKFIADVLGPESIFTANGETWRRNRRLFAPAFHPSVIKAFPRSFVKHSNVLIDVLSEELNREIDIMPYLRRLGYDLISETSLDLEMHAQRGESQVFNDSMRLFEIISRRMWQPWLQPDFIFNMLPLGREHHKLVNRMNAYILKTVEEQQERYVKSLAEKQLDPVEAEKNKSPLIYHMLRNGCSFEEIADQVATIAATGYDTTAVTMSFTLMALGMHQEIQERLYQEVVAVEEALAGREVEMEDLDLYTYMELVFKESMRMFPVGSILTRTCMDDVKFSKYTIPKGTEVAAVMFKTHRDPRWFPDPLRFDPDRFLPENSEGRHPFCYVPFSAGPRNCIGTKYAMMSMKIILSRILLKYKVHCRYTVPEVKVRVEVTATVDGGFNISLEERT